MSTLLSQVTEQFNLQASAPQFKVTTWELGFHIIPTAIRDETGAVVVSSNPLDATISVPEGKRSATEQLRELCAAVSIASGVPVELEVSGIRPWVDQVFATKPSPFMWGGNGMVARDALADLVLRSATSLTWQLLCQPSAAAQDRFCFLNIRLVELHTRDSAGKATETPLTYDRCGECPGRTARPPLPAPEQ